MRMGLLHRSFLRRCANIKFGITSHAGVRALLIFMSWGHKPVLTSLANEDIISVSMGKLSLSQAA